MPHRIPGISDESIEEVIASPRFEPSSVLSLIIVAYRRGGPLLECLESLTEQESAEFDVHVVDNGGNEAAFAELSRFPVRWYRMKRNVGACYGRNLAAGHARGDLVGFIDDDCRARADLTAAFTSALDDPAIYALRGRVLPKSDNGYNVLCSGYDRGDEIFPFTLNAEAVTAIRKEHLLKVGGWNLEIWGHEGLELSFRLAERFGREGMVYHPGPVVYHDYADGLRKLLRKDLRHMELLPQIEALHPGFREFMTSYTQRYCRLHPEKLSFPLRVKMGLIRRFRELLRRSPAVQRAVRVWVG